MERLTEKRQGQNVIPLRQTGLEKIFKFALVKISDNTRFLYGDPANKLSAYEDTGLTPEEVEALKAFKAYFDDMYGKGLEVANWHMNGNLEPFDNFYENANNAGKIHCRNCDYLNMDSGKPYCCHPHMSTSGLDDWCDHAKRKENNNA